MKMKKRIKEFWKEWGINKEEAEMLIGSLVIYVPFLLAIFLK